MKRKFKNNNIFIVIALIISFMSCKDENVIQSVNQQNLQSSHDYLLFEKTLLDIEREIEHALIATGTTKNLPMYISLNTDSTDQDTLIINFGEENYLHLGHLKRGEIISIYNKFIYNSNAQIATTFNNFYINNNLIQGKMFLENNGSNQNGFQEFALTVDSMSMYTKNGSIDISSGNYIKELVSGNNTQYQYLDNIYKVTGNALGNSSNNNNFSIEISDSLNMNLSCFESSSCVITGGTARLIPNGYEERIINYGDNTCDCDVNAIIGEDVHPIIIN
ncbi:hypothetical protein OAQ16_03790 [Flavobacteriales bacterium]|nr:hypothetical protein [Flavobacteriales bacterium]